ncbi:ATP-binding protein [Chitinophagaceae bacterium LWZ2-11]
MTGFRNKMLKRYLLSFIALLLCTNIYCQTKEIRRLQLQLPTIKDSTKYVNTLNRIGLLIHMKNADSCFYYATKSIEIANRLNYSRGKADAYNNMAAALFLKGLYNESLAQFTKALKEFEKLEAKSAVANMLMNSAIVYGNLGDSVNAKRCSERAIDIGRTLYPDSVVSMVYADYDNLNHSLSEDSSRYYLDRAKTVAEKFKDYRTLLFIKQIKADKLIKKGKYDEAFPLITESLQMSKDDEFEYHEIQSLDLYADYFFAKKNIDSALSCYNKMYGIIIDNNYDFLKAPILQAIQHCYELKKDDKNVLKTSKLLIAALEIENNKNKNFIGDYIQYNQAQEDLKSLNIKNQLDQKRIGWLIGLCVLCAVIIIIVLVLYKTSKKYSKALKELNEKVNAQNQLLHQTDEFKSSLISMLAHDFRTPLSSVLSMVALLKNEINLDKNELTILYNYIEADVENILLTFDNMLIWIKKQLSGYVVNSEILSIHNLIKEAASMFKTELEANRLIFQNQVPDNLVISSDKEIIQFIHRNLIHNALKFSPQGGAITVAAKSINNEIIVSVQDEGAGISEEQIKKIFSFDNDKRSNSAAKGAGVALTICKEFIEKLHGRIGVESKPGQGSVFYYAIPINTKYDLRSTN